MINISYGNITFLPTPNVSISTEYLNEGGSGISKQHRISLNGVLYNSGTGFTNVSEVYQPKPTGILTISTVNYNVKVISCNLEPTNDNWSKTIKFSMDFEGVLGNESPAFNTNGNWLVSKIQDDWSIEPLDDNFKKVTMPDFDTKLYTEKLAYDKFYEVPFIQYPYFKITRVLGAVGRYEVLHPDPLLNAKQWIDNYTTNNPLTNFLSNFNNVYNHTRSVSKNNTEGSFIVTDNWIASRDSTLNYIQTINVDSSLNQEGLRTVTVNGEIKGLSLSSRLWGDPGASGSIVPALNDYNEKYTNALARYNQLAGLGPYAFFPSGNRNNNMVYDGNYKFVRDLSRNESLMNPTPLSSGVNHNKTEGSIKFNLVYNNRPINYFSGMSETINIQDSLGLDRIISQIVMYGPPVLQNLGTKSSNTRNITIDVKLYNNPATQSIVDYYNTLESTKTACKTLTDSLNPKNVLSNITMKTLLIDSFSKYESSRIDIANNSLSYSRAYEWTFRSSGIP